MGAPKPATQSGKIPFNPPGSGVQGETAFWLWGDLKSEKVPLIGLHGGPGAPGRDWVPAASFLHEQYDVPVILYDQLGCGASTHLREKKGDTTFWSTELFVDELRNVIKHFELEKYHLLGHSDGVITAATFALTQPHGLQKLVIASAAPSNDLRLQSHARLRSELPEDVQKAMETSEGDKPTSSSAGEPAFMVFLRRYLCRINPWPPEVDEVMKLIGEDDTIMCSLYGPDPNHTTGPRKNYDLTGRLSEITQRTVPGGVLLTNGKYDMTQDEAMAPFFTGIRANVKWVRFAASSHMAHLEEPEDYLRTLGQFLTAP